MRRTIAVIVVVIILLGGGYFFTQQQNQSDPAAQFEILRQATADQGRIEATVNATGSIEPEALVSLTFGLGGTIQTVNVVRGQMVTAGDVLASLNAEELRLAVQQAEDALRIQELTLQQRLNTEPSEATLASAQADIDAAEASVTIAEANVVGAEANILQAQAQKAQLLAGATAGQIAAAEATLASARSQQDTAQKAYNRTLDCFTQTNPDGSEQEVCPGLGPAEEQARANLANANASLRAAELQLADLRTAARPSDIQAADASIAAAEANLLAAQGQVASAEATLARAQAAYDRLLEPISDDEIAILEAQVASARTNRELAQLRLDQATIVAPISGRVASVLINPGEQGQPGAPAITILNEGAYHINVNVDEIDIDKIAVGQDVSITLDAFDDVTVDGEIAEIAPTAANSSGLVTYLVTINIIEADIPLRAGMSANAAIVVEAIEDTLRVPNWAIRLDRETGTAYVNRLNNQDLPEEVAIETGLRNDQFSEVTSGLNAGDVVVVTNQRDSFSFFGGEE
ncbi:MAG TPA: efflux RND transporter periplasmic adaptor subunit [Anaerolineae bacterium]|nr:efflux RND transporter periplasmic adaptor subunit [Anaerolineae bacterium]